MIKLTVMYNLPPGADHEEFMRWRTTEHQAENMGIPGIIKSDFYVIAEAWQQEGLPYHYIEMPLAHPVLASNDPNSLNPPFLLC